MRKSNFDARIPLTPLHVHNATPTCVCTVYASTQYRHALHDSKYPVGMQSVHGATHSVHAFSVSQLLKTLSKCVYSYLPKRGARPLCSKLIGVTGRHTVGGSDLRESGFGTK